MDDLSSTELARLGDYFAGELTPREAALVERWIQENPERRQFVKTLHQSRIDLGDNASAHIEDLPHQVTLLSKSFAQIRQGERLRDPSNVAAALSSNGTGVRLQVPALHRWLKTSYVIGALAASLILVFAGWRLAEWRYGMFSPRSVSTYTTNNGERATVTLPDGSTVVLNVGSRLQVPSDFTAGNRTVHLAGQAFFTVVSHTGSPFTVMAGPSVTRVLGTRFFVRHYESDTAATVLVRDGKVSVGASVLTAAQEISVSASGVSAVRQVNLNTLSFTQGVLTLNQISLVDAIPELNRWYDVEIRLGDPALANRQVAGGFKAGSTSDLVSILELMYNARVVRDGRVLTLYPRR